MPILDLDLTSIAGWQNLLGMAVIVLPVGLVVLLGIASLIERKLSERTTAWAVYLVTSFGLAASAGVFVLMLLGDSRHVVVDLGDWVHVDHIEPAPDYHFAAKFVFDRLSVPFVAITLILCGTISAFAYRYMHREQGFNRFFVLFSIFLSGMVIASLAGSIETLFLGWEMVGLSGGLLVAFFHDRPAPGRNALRIWTVYRLSDAALLLAAVALHHMRGHGDLDQITGYRASPGYDEITSWPHGICPLGEGQIVIVGLLLLIAAAGKSALVPFSGWLPRAMEGPTPSSAIFYGALSVHLGAFLLLRIGPLIDASITLSVLVTLIGLATAGLAALIARAQTDVKSLLSYASLTQVGLIVAEIGLGFRYFALVHLLGHACLRTLQFVRAPSFLRDRMGMENAIGGRVSSASSGSGAWLYLFSMERAFLDAVLDRYVVGPFIRVFTWLDRLERRCINSVEEPKTSAALVRTDVALEGGAKR